MAFTTNLNIPPYYNDYDETKNYHQILFRPSTAVQARELTQLQNIFQTQIERFGQWAFKNGDIVQGCSVNDLPVVPYVFLADADASANGYDARTFINCIAVSATSNLRARVLFANVGFQANYPNCNIIYLNYLNTGNNGASTFSNNELIQFYNINANGMTLVTNNANVYTLSNVAGTNTTGNAHGISVNEGIVFLDGAFVKVETPTFGLVNNFGTYAANNVVGFQALESIITENQDSSLYDNALGYPNENAPGAHRLKITPSLVSLDPTTASSTTGFNPIATYNFGSIATKSSDSQLYSTINSAIATRIYEEAGNYVVNPFTVDTITNSGDSAVSPANSNYLFAKVGTGIGYSQGSRVTVDKPLYINMRRGIDTQVNKSQQITFNYGGYFIVDEVSGTFDFTKAQTVQLYDAPQLSVTSRKFTGLTPTGNNIGTAVARCFSYSSGVPGTNNAIYNLHLFNINLSSGYNINNIQSVYYSSGSIKGVADINTSGYQNSSQKDQFFGFGVNGINALRDSSNNNNTEYVYRKIDSSTIHTDGTITVTIASSATGGVDELPYGVGLLSDGNARTITICPSANGLSSALTGTVQVFTTSANIVGTSTTFTSDFSTGDVILVGSDYRTITSITNNTFMVADSPFSSSTSGASYYQAFPAGKEIYFSLSSNGSYGYVNVTNSTSFTVQTSKLPASAVPVNVTYDILRTSVTPAKKVINKNRFVKINTANSINGPWCLGFSDIHNVSAVYSSSDGTYSTGNQNVTNMFTFSTGQKDTHYDLGYLYLKPGMSVVGNPYLLVQLDYFSPNTTPGLGFFTVESYPIDDTNTANNNAIQTKDIPLYVDENGTLNPLRDYVDFRPVGSITATDTGYVDVTNATAVAAAVSTASLNPANTLSFSAPTSGFNVPSYNFNLQADYTMYLPRYDLVYITPDNVIKTKEGASSTNPSAPISPDNGMIIAQMYIPPYPSLTSDQVNSLTPINQSCYTLCRDTTKKTLVTLLSNRRYTMGDVGKLDKRITNLEYYAQLSLLQQKTKDLTITDANGLDRFKNGIFVDPFSDFKLSDVSNPEFSIAIDSGNGYARPKFVKEIIKLQFNNTLTTVSNTSTGGRNFYIDTTNNVQKTGRCVTLPYTETQFISQPYATKYRSASHVAFAWNGTVTLFPSYNNHTDLNQAGAVNMTVDTATPWQNFASSPFAYTWGDWRTTTNTQVTTVMTGSVDTYNININYGGTQSGGQTPPNSYTTGQLYNILTYNGITPSSDFVIGKVSNVYLGGGGNYSGSVPAGALTVQGINYGGGGGNAGATALLIAWAMGWI